MTKRDDHARIMWREDGRGLIRLCSSAQPGSSGVLQPFFYFAMWTDQNITVGTSIAIRVIAGFYKNFAAVFLHFY